MSTPPQPFATWEDEYCLHNEVVDNQHRHLVGLVSDMYAAVVANEAKEGLVKRLTSLLNFAKAHFVTEEQLLRMHKYPKFLVHKAAHEGLAHALAGLRQQVVLGERELTREYVELIKLWVLDHFGEFDRKCGDLLREDGGKAEKALDRGTSPEP
jgi:hemerythrin